jgi:hypothetical protein
MVINVAQYLSDIALLYSFHSKGFVTTYLPSMENGNSELPIVEGGGCSSVRAREPR